MHHHCTSLYFYIIRGTLSIGPLLQSASAAAVTRPEKAITRIIIIISNNIGRCLLFVFLFF
jgi:hypothetical protein